MAHGAVSEKQVAAAAGQHWGIPFADLSATPPSPEARTAHLPGADRRPLPVVPMGLGSAPAARHGRPAQRFHGLDAVRAATDYAYEIDPVLATEADIVAAIAGHIAAESRGLRH